MEGNLGNKQSGQNAKRGERQWLSDGHVMFVALLGATEHGNHSVGNERLAHRRLHQPICPGVCR